MGSLLVAERVVLTMAFVFRSMTPTPDMTRDEPDTNVHLPRRDPLRTDTNSNEPWLPARETTTEHHADTWEEADDRFGPGGPEKIRDGF